MKKQMKKVLALFLVLCMMVPMTALAASKDVYTLYVSIGSIEDREEFESLRPSEYEDKYDDYVADKTKYLTGDDNLLAEVVKIITKNYWYDDGRDSLWVFDSPAMRAVMDAGLEAYEDGESDWQDWLDEGFFTAVQPEDGDRDLKSLLADMDTEIEDVDPNEDHMISYYNDVDGDRKEGTTYVVTVRVEKDTEDDDDDKKPGTVKPAPTPDKLNGDEHFQYIFGNTKGEVKPLAKITRAEVASIFYRLLKDDVRAQYFTTESDLPDLHAGLWYNKAAATLVNAGIFAGCDDGLFHGERNITRAELATVIAKFDSSTYAGADLFDDISTHWARPYINACAANGWIVGDGSGKYRPYDAITRAEVMTMINAVLNRGVDADGLCAGYKQFPDNIPGTWYYYQVIEATNYHEYVREADGSEQWTAILPDKVWNE